MTVLAASDLDRTLIYSAKALRLGEPVDRPVAVERRHGADVSFLGRAAVRALAALSRQVHLVPVTTRIVEQYDRVHFPKTRVRHAVTTNGAVILADGRPCPDWADAVDKRLAEVASYAEARGVLDPLLVRPWVRRIRDAERRFVYALLRPEYLEPGWLEEVEAAADALGWVMSRQGRKVYLIPRTLTKEAAVAEIASRVGATRLLAAGDSLLDRGLLLAADRAIRPAHGELHEVGWTAPHLTVTRSPGGRAADEIVAWFAADAGGVDYGGAVR